MQLSWCSIDLRGIDGHGHFKTELISLERRPLYKNIRKYQHLKGKIYDFLKLNNSL